MTLEEQTGRSELGCKAMDNEPQTGKPRNKGYRSLNMPGDYATSDTRTEDDTERERIRWLMGSQISSRYREDGGNDSLGKGLTR